MGIWFRAPGLTESESVIWKKVANRTQSANRAVGGRLYLTETRLIFEPGHFDALTGGRPWSTPLHAIRGTGSQDRDGSPFSGGLRNRLRLDLADGSVELFVINDLDLAIEVLERATASA
ncbi:hypothetical protein [Nocardia sp. NPDC057668]|uniref:hypothetical protein n=1 Tax=Nocardia sp. NPDC057668 TaxID=3346202 RepID=UPI00367075DD